MAEGRSATSFTFDKPPWLNAESKISSSLNLVGLKTTFTPFFNTHSVVPNCSFLLTFLILPALGALSISGLLKSSSALAVSSAFLLSAIN